MPRFRLSGHWLSYFFSVISVVAGSWDALAQVNDTIDPVNPDQIHGELRSRQVTSLSSEIPARIDKITLREGYKFKKALYSYSWTAH